MKNDFFFSKINGVSIYADDLTAYATESYLLYSRIINNHQRQAGDLASSVAFTKSRANAIRSLREAIIFNLEPLYKIQRILEPYVDAKLLVKYNGNANDDLNGFLKDFRYLRRDWSWEDTSEEQLQDINRAIRRYLEPLEAANDQNALFLGGGVGRIAFDLASLYEKVYITDKSFSMAHHFNLLKTKDIEFYEVNYKNIPSHLDSTRKVRVTMYPDQLDKNLIESILNKIEYFVSDVTHLPFKDNTISNIFSVYFSDVLALKLWLPEVKRIIRPNGLFIHFGPLDYFFSDVTEMLSAQEFRLVFEQNGFETICDETVDCFHLPVPEFWSKKQYTNWLFIARMKDYQSNSRQIKMTDFIQQINSVDYVLRGNLSLGNELKEYELKTQGGTILEGSEGMIEIIKFVGEGKLVGEIFSELELNGALKEDDRQSILRVLELLVESTVLKITRN